MARGCASGLRCDQLALAAATPLRNVLLITVDDLRPQLNKRMR